MKKKRENKKEESKRVSRFPNRDKKSADRNSCPKGQAGAHPANDISTVFNIKKPSAIGFYIPAEGCISGSRAVRACLMIRVFNN